MLLETLFGRRPAAAQNLATYKDYDWWDDAGWVSRSSSGVSVNEDTALNLSAVYRATALLVGSISTLPLPVYRRVSDEEREKISDHAVSTLLNRRPNPLMGAQVFREVMQANLLLWGNAYAEVVRDMAGTPVELWPIHPRYVKPQLAESGDLEYEIRFMGGETFRLPSRNVLHLKNVSPDGLVGWSVIRLARESLGLSLAAEQFGAGFFGNGSRPSGVLRTPQRLSEQAVKELRKSWGDLHDGPTNAGRVAVLQGGLEWQATGIPPEDAQFLETRKFQVVEVSRWFGVPPHMIYDLDRATFSNIEHQGLEFLSYSLRYWLVKWERGCEEKLLTENEDDLYLEHLTDALLRTDIGSRYNAYAVGRNNGWLSINDIRKRENLPTVGEAGDVYLAPLNMAPLDSLLEEEQPEPDPPAPPVEEEDDEEDEVPEDAPPEEDEGNPAEEAMRALFVATLERMLRKEAKAIEGAAKKPSGFLAWMDRYLVHLRGQMAETLSPVHLAYWSVVGQAPAGDVGSLARDHYEYTRQALLDLTGQCTASDFLGAITTWLPSWQEGEVARLTQTYLVNHDAKD